MGLVCSQARLLMLYDRKSTLEFQMQCITSRLMAAAANTANIANMQSAQYNALTTAGTNEAAKNSANANLGALEGQLAQVNAWEKQLEQMQKQIETQHNAVQTEIESVKKIIDKNVESSFKYFG